MRPVDCRCRSSCLRVTPASTVTSRSSTLSRTIRVHARQIDADAAAQRNRRVPRATSPRRTVSSARGAPRTPRRSPARLRSTRERRPRRAGRPCGATRRGCGARGPRRRSRRGRRTDREAGPAARPGSFPAGDLLDQFLGQRQADAAVGIVEAALRQRQAAAARAVLGVERLQRFGAPLAATAPARSTPGILLACAALASRTLVLVLGVDDRRSPARGPPASAFRARSATRSACPTCFCASLPSRSRMNDVGSA